MDGSDTLEEFSEWEEAAEDVMDKARLQGCRSELALQQQRSDGEGPAKVRQGSAKIRQKSGEGPAKVRQKSGGDRGRGNGDEKKRYLKLWIPC